jgi:hypothetical protein
MTNSNVAITIWWKTILINALFTGAWAVFGVGAQVILVIMVLVVGGFIVTMPLLLLISLLVKLQRSIPYAPHVRYAWFRSMLVLIVWLFYTLIQLIVVREWPPRDWIYYAAGISTSLAVVTAIAFTRRDIVSLPTVTSSKVSFHLKAVPDV